MNPKQFYLLILALITPLTRLAAIKIHVFGDSHAAFCFSNERTAIPRDEQSIFTYHTPQKTIPINFYIHWLGSKTMHAIGRDGLKALNLKDFNVQEKDVAVFVFGEIDARCHIGKQRDLNNRKLDEIIDTLSNNFLRCIYENKQAFKKLTCVVVSVTPPTNNAYNWVYPYHGPIEDRVSITQQLNAKLEKLCPLYGIKFLDIYSSYATPEGILDDTKGDGVVHVNPKTNDQIKLKLIDLLRTKAMV